MVATVVNMFWKEMEVIGSMAAKTKWTDRQHKVLFSVDSLPASIRPIPKRGSRLILARFK